MSKHWHRPVPHYGDFKFDLKLHPKWKDVIFPKSLTRQISLSGCRRLNRSNSISFKFLEGFKGIGLSLTESLERLEVIKIS